MVTHTHITERTYSGHDSHAASRSSKLPSWPSRPPESNNAVASPDSPTHGAPPESCGSHAEPSLRDATALMTAKDARGLLCSEHEVFWEMQSKVRPPVSQRAQSLGSSLTHLHTQFMPPARFQRRTPCGRPTSLHTRTYTHTHCHLSPPKKMALPFPSKSLAAPCVCGCPPSPPGVKDVRRQPCADGCSMRSGVPPLPHLHAARHSLAEGLPSER